MASSADDPGGTIKSNHRLDLLDRTLRIVLATLFALAAGTKSANVALLVSAIGSVPVVPVGSAAILAYLVVALEWTLAVGLIFHATARLGAFGTVGLASCFVAYNVAAIHFRIDPFGCPCVPFLLRLNHYGSLALDLALIGAGSWLALKPPPKVASPGQEVPA